MATTSEAVEVYRQVAEEYQRLGAPEKRDRFFLLAADAAYALGHREEAERLRRSILNGNPDHLLKPYGSLEEALRSPDIQAYVQQLRRRYPLESASALLVQLRRTGQASPAASSLPPPRHAFDDLTLPLETDVRGNGQAATPPGRSAVRPAASPRPGKEKPMSDAAQPGRPANNPKAVWPAGTPSRETPGGPGVFGLKPEPLPPRPSPLAPAAAPLAAPTSAPEEPIAGAWVGGMLCVVAVLAALALLVYVFAAPFVPWW